jgi:hypothetical protein
VLNTVPNKVTREMNNRLPLPYAEEDVKTTLFQMFATKAPGPGDMLVHIYQRHWDLCGREVTKVVLNVLNGGKFLELINQTVPILIPKAQHPWTLPQFQLIRLRNVVLKNCVQSSSQ